MDETTFTFTRKEILQPNERVIIKGEGMPIYGQPNQFGDLFITFTISFPSSLSSSDINRSFFLFYFIYKIILNIKINNNNNK